MFDLTQGNVSCIFFQNEWQWTFTPNNGTITNTGGTVVIGNTTVFIQGNFENNANLNISSGSGIFIQGNFTQSSGGQIVFTFSTQQQNNKSSPLNVGGCVSINGNISLNLETQPQQGIPTESPMISPKFFPPLHLFPSELVIDNPSEFGWFIT